MIASADRPIAERPESTSRRLPFTFTALPDSVLMNHWKNMTAAEHAVYPVLLFESRTDDYRYRPIELTMRVLEVYRARFLDAAIRAVFFNRVGEMLRDTVT